MKIQHFLLAATASMAISGAANAATLIQGTFSTALGPITSSTPLIGAGSVLTSAFGFVTNASDDFVPIIGSVFNFAPITATNGSPVAFNGGFGSFSGNISNLVTTAAPNSSINFDSFGSFIPAGVLGAYSATNARLTVSFTQTGNLIAGRDPPVISGSWTLATVAVPEPASWAMLIAGFGLVGAVARRRRQVVAA